MAKNTKHIEGGGKVKRKKLLQKNYRPGIGSAKLSDAIPEAKAMSKGKSNKFKNPDLTDLNNELRGRGDSHALEQISFYEGSKNRPGVKEASLYSRISSGYKNLDEKMWGLLPGGGHLKQYARALTYLVSGGDPLNPIPEEPLLKTWDDRNVRNNGTKLNPK